MANLTIVVDDGVLRRARKKAIDQGTSVNAVVGAYLEQYAGPDGAAAALEGLPGARGVRRRFERGVGTDVDARGPL